MRVISASDVDRVLGYTALADALARTFAEGVQAPTRHHHTIERPDGADTTLLLMPAWSDFCARGTSADGYIGVKLVTVSPDNNALAKPAVMGVYILSDGQTGEPLALIDGQALTVWRTATASALAGRYLARKNASRMAMLGAGRLAPHLIRAHAAMRPISHVTLWNRSRENADAVAEALRDDPFEVRVVEDREEAIRDADIISAATISETPLIEGRWLKPGAHVDLVGAFTPKLRESDDETVRRATLFVDTFDGALTEGGDLVQPIAAGIVSRDNVKADLAMLASGTHPGRTSDDEITLFKSTGCALEDFAAGILVYETITRDT
ncbi:ornithine cyclodeaminase family protein [Georhizobium profundi]|uniref:Ornithine cyclodeaminase family protein n=1 Tax=Georhizobium profundi TaxID=2341112 RepID=A0A3Q8XKT1_9HYPH|nr:ornithine cyclodeaminase family protein [Georhizobium profundi]AZN69896.1 ornithine cyclodeaminase family protein [Georhizobium profundi]